MSLFTIQNPGENLLRFQSLKDRCLGVSTVVFHEYLILNIDPSPTLSILHDRELLDSIRYNE